MDFPKYVGIEFLKVSINYILQLADVAESITKFTQSIVLFLRNRLTVVLSQIIYYHSAQLMADLEIALFKRLHHDGVSISTSLRGVAEAMGAKVGYAMKMVVTPESVIKGDPCWGFSHEVGHVHQTRPMFNWGGLGEVSNNLFSLYVTRSFGNKTRVSEQNNF